LEGGYLPSLITCRVEIAVSRFWTLWIITEKGRWPNGPGVLIHSHASLSVTTFSTGFNLSKLYYPWAAHREPIRRISEKIGGLESVPLGTCTVRRRGLGD